MSSIAPSTSLSNEDITVAPVASGTGVAVLPESVLDVVNTDPVARHPLPVVLAEIVTPLIWRATEASPSVIALQGLLDVDAKRSRTCRSRLAK